MLRVLEQDRPPKAVVRAFGIDVKTVRKRFDRFRLEGPTGLTDRSPFGVAHSKCPILLMIGKGK